MRSLGSCDVGLDDAFVPDELVLGEPGRAWYMLLPTLNNERIMLSSFCVGILDGILEDVLAYMKEREAFGKKIGQFQILQHYVADIAMWRRQGRAFGLPGGDDAQRRPGLLHGVQHGQGPGVRVRGQGGRPGDTDLRRQWANSAETDAQRYWRDARLFRIGPVTNEMARNSIAELHGPPAVVLMSVPGLEHLPGTELPAGTFTITAEEDARVLEVVGGEPAPDGTAHPLWAYIAPQRGIGISVADICALAEFDVNDGPMLGSSELELHSGIRLDEPYTVTGRVLSIDRKQGGSGTFDLMRSARTWSTAGGNVVAVSTSTYVLPRKAA